MTDIAPEVPAKEEPETKLPETKAHMICCIERWWLYAFMGSIVMGVGLYFYAIYFSKMGITASAYVGPGPLVLLIAFKVYIAIRNKCTLGTFINMEKSNIWDKDGNLQCKNLVPVLGNVYANTSHVFFFSYAFKYAKMGGLNQGIIPIMTTLASLFNSVLFYFAFDEKISYP